MAVVGPLAACPGLSFLPAWQVNRTGRKGSLQVNENSESVRAGIVCTHHCMYTSLYVHIQEQDQTRSKKRQGSLHHRAPFAQCCRWWHEYHSATWIIRTSPKLGPLIHFSEGLCLKGLVRRAKLKKIFVGSIGKKWHRKSGKESISLYVPYIGPKYCTLTRLFSVRRRRPISSRSIPPPPPPSVS